MSRISRRIAATCVLAAAGALCAACAKEPAQLAPAATSVVALDGADWRNVLPLIRQGKLPTLAALSRAGSSGTMRTNPDFRWSPVLWTTIATGKLPEKHGVTSFMAEMPGLTRKIPTPSTARTCRAIWNIFTDRDRTSGFVGWWVTWPAETVNGFMVSDHFSVSRFDLGLNYEADLHEPVLEEKQTYPEDLLSEIERFKVQRHEVVQDDLSHFADLPPDFVFPATFRKFDRVSEFAIAYSVDRTHFGAGRALLEARAPELFGVFIQGVDIMQHFNWEFIDPAGTGTRPAAAERRMWSKAIERYYGFADGLIRELVDAGGPSRAVMVVSDHGFRPGTERYAQKHISGEHRRQALFVFAGPGLERGRIESDADAVDVTPTILAYHGLPTARDMDGAPLTGCFTDAWAAERPLHEIDTYETAPLERPELPTRSLGEGLEERIRSLGYIE
jgi:predicted AlkP superfamily phosphohydrolase/phosphomutase